MNRLFLALALLLVTAPAYADPVTILGFAASYFIGSQAVYYAVTIGLTLYSGYRANRAAKKAAAAAKNNYNASLQDRMVTAIADSPARRVVYGAGLYGGDVVAIFTTDKTNEDGSIKKDGYKHLVIVCAAHRVKAIKDLRIAGYMAGATAMSGWAAASVFTQQSDFYKSQQYAGNLRNVTLPTIAFGRIVGSGSYGPQIISITAQQGDTVIRRVPDGGWTLSGYNLTLPNTVDGVTIDASYTWVVAYSFGGTQALSKVYVSKFLGSSTQTVDAYLNGLLPSYWTSNDRLRGLAGAVVTLDLTEPLFQSGIPEILFDLEGRDEIYDPRDGTTKYTTNPALIVDDWLRQDWGFGVTPNSTWTIAAANACDVSTAYIESGVSKTGARYTCNGSFSTADDKERVLADLLLSMAGRVINSADWRILAGAWTPAVRTIVDGDDMGPLQILQAGQSIDDLFNGVRGRYVPFGQSSPVDINPPYKNSTFVTADGQELWETIDLPFVDTSYRAVQIARVMTEVNRNGLMVGYPAKLKHWDLEVGQRVALTNAEYGFSAKTFLLLNWEFTVEGAVLLQMIEDDSGAYDLGDASVADPTPNTNLPNPNVVQKPTGVTTAASTAELLRLQDGTIVPQVRVNWTSNDSYMQGGSFEVSWEAFLDDPGTIHTVTVAGDVREVLLQGVTEYQTVMVRIVAVNVLGRRSDPVFATQVVYGKTTAPAAITGLAATRTLGALRITRDPSTELDWSYTNYEYSTNGGTSWSPIPAVSDRGGAVWNNPVTGALKIRARDVDTSGNVGPYTAPIDVTVDPDNVGGASATLAIKINTTDFAGTLNYNEAYIHGRDSSGAPADINGTIQLNGAIVSVPKGQMFTSQGPVSAFIVWDQSGTGFPRDIGGTLAYVLARKINNQWQYDNNSAWVNFTPAASHYVIGLMQIGNADTNTAPGIQSATMLSAAWVPDSIAGIADAATTAAAAAQSTANTAATNASDALTAIGVIQSDGVLARGEKSEIIKEVAALFNEQSGIDAQAGVYGITTEKTAYDNSLTALGTYLNGLSPAWNDTTQDTTIVATNFRNAFTNVYSARQTLLNKIADAAGKVANWTGVAGRPSTYRVGARGNSATGYPLESSLINADTNAVIVSAGAMYRVASIARTTGVVTDHGAFILYTAGQADAMAAVLNGLDSSKIVVVFTFDEPQAGRSGSLVAAMYRCGASRNVWGSSGFRYRGAYILVGIGGCGEGNGAENYAGSVDSDTAAWCDMTFQITATGALVVSGTTRGATTLVDYGYIGSLDATTNKPYYQSTDPTVSPGGIVDGAIWINTSTGKAYQRVGGAWQPYVGSGSVGTGELGAGAATAVTQDTFDLTGSTTPGGSGHAGTPPYTLREVAVTPTVNCVIEFTARMDGSVQFDSGANLGWALSVNGGAESILASFVPEGTSGTYYSGTGTVTVSFSATAGVPLYFRVKGYRLSGGPNPRPGLSQMRVTEVKR